MEAVAKIGAEASLDFYDWEANVIGEPSARDPSEQPIRNRSEDEALAASHSGTVVVEAEAPVDNPNTESNEAEAAAPGYFVIRDRPALSSVDIEDPEQVLDPITNQPVLAFGFTEAGRKKFEQLTERIVHRSAKQAPPEISDDSTRATAFSDHFAIVLDGQILSRPIINFVDNPAGIDGRNGASIGGNFTVQEAKALVSFLETGPLPVKLVRSG
jgi:SecD/SecF fusion protein